MAFGAATIWHVQQSGSDTANGGAFDTGTTMATDLAATSATGTAPVVTSATYNFAAGDVGHYLFIKSGTNWLPGWYLIASVASNAATLTATIGSAISYTLSSLGVPSTVAGCATTASPTAGTWSMDYSRSNTPRVAFTDMVIGGTTTQFTSAANPVGPNMVGNLISVTSGTGFTVQRVTINSTSTITATCDKSLGTTASTGGNGGLGGAFASPGAVGGLGVTGNDMAIQYNATAYTMSSSNNVAGGRVTWGGRTVFGFNTNRHYFNTDTRPIFKPSGNTYILFTGSSNSTRWHNLDITNPAGTQTGNTGIALQGNFSGVHRCRINACKNGIDCQTTVETITSCEVSDGNESGGFGINSSGSTLVQGCHVFNQKGGGIIGGGNGAMAIGCIVAGNRGLGGGILSHTAVINCVVYGITGGANNAFQSCGTHVNCIAESNDGFGYNFAANGNGAVINCSGYLNTGGNISTSSLPDTVGGFITQTASAFVSPGVLASSDFTLNSTTGGGALLKALGSPLTYPPV